MNEETEWIGEFSLKDREEINSLRAKQVFSIKHCLCDCPKQMPIPFQFRDQSHAIAIQMIFIGTSKVMP